MSVTNYSIETLESFAEQAAEDSDVELLHMRQVENTRDPLFQAVYLDEGRFPTANLNMCDSLVAVQINTEKQDVAVISDIEYDTNSFDWDTITNKEFSDIDCAFDRAVEKLSE